MRRSCVEGDLRFRLMALEFRFRDWWRPPLDVVLLYDVLHDIGEPASALSEIHRVLKPGGTLSVSDHHLRPQILVETASAGGLFKLAGHGRWTFRFERAPAGVEAT